MDIAAVLSIAEDGDVVCIDSGATFRPTEALTVSKGVTLCGRDRATDEVATATFDGSEFTGSRHFLDFSNSTAAPKIRNLTFRNFAAGALSFTSVTGAEIEDCVFVDNGGDGVDNGGAVLFLKCTAATVARSTFSGNRATSFGGAVSFYSPICDNAIRDCTFTGVANAAYGKCLYMGTGLVSNCVFKAVTCERNGSNGDFGMICMGGGTLMNCKVSGSYLYTRFLQVQGGTEAVNVRNLLLADDNTMHATAFSLVSTYNGHGAVFDNCTILTPGQPLFASSTSQSPHYVFNSCALVGKWPTAPGTVTYEANVCTDPSVSIDELRFVDPSVGNYIPRSDSPLLDVAEPLDWQTAADAIDLGGRTRIVGEKVDLGCYERQPTDADYVDTRVVATEADRIGDWAEAIVGLQAAIDSTVGNAARLLVKSGMYLVGETIQVTNRSLVVVSCGADGKPDRDGTILDGQSARRILRIVPSTLDATTFLPTTDARVTFEGFTFRNGTTHADDGLVDAGMGGAVYFSGRSKAKGKFLSRIVNCRFSNCEADFGGAVAMEGGELVNCTFDGNKADVDEDETATSAIGGQGGAIGIIMRKELSQRTAVCLSRDATWVAPGIIGCTFTDNTAEASGAAISVYRKRVDGFGVGSAYVAGCSFEGNVLTWPTDRRDYSEGVCVSVCYNGLVTNCLFRANGTSTIGYGVVMMDGVGQMVDCTLVANDSVYGSVYGASSNAAFERCRFEDNRRYVRAAGTFRNCLFMAATGHLINAVAADATYDNCTFIVPETSGLAYFPAGKTNRLAFNNCILYRPNGLSPLEMDCKGYTLSFASCCISKEPKASMAFDDGCLLNVDPRFVDAAAQDYSLKLRSPCVDRGLLLDWMTADSVDLSGNVRVLNNGKALSDDANALPDMGCFEMQDAKRGSRMILR